MRLTVPTIILASSAVVNAAAVPAFEERGWLGDIASEVESVVSTVAHDVSSGLTLAEKTLLKSASTAVTSAWGDVLKSFDSVADAENTIECAYKNFLGTTKAPNTDGIEWFEDVEWVARFLLTNAFTEYAENKVFTAFESEIQLLEKGGAGFVGGVASSLGLNGTWFNDTALDGVEAIQNLIEGVAVTAVDDLGKILEDESAADTVETFISKAIQVGTKSVLDLFETSLDLTGVGAVIPLAIPFACTAGEILADGVTTIEACTVNIGIVSQVLSELQILAGHCALVSI